MGDWEHKERNWSRDSHDDASGRKVSMTTWINGVDGNGYSEPNSKWMKFTDWLDLQCKGGWEVFKISRDFSGQNSGGSWCIFRRKNQ
jgi:hypothetical protein